MACASSSTVPREDLCRSAVPTHSPLAQRSGCMLCSFPLFLSFAFVFDPHRSRSPCHQALYHSSVANSLGYRDFASASRSGCVCLVCSLWLFFSHSWPLSFLHSCPFLCSAFFFASHDNQFILKSATTEDARYFLQILKDYEERLTSGASDGGNSLLYVMCGLYRFSRRPAPFYLIVMKNVFATDLPIHLM